MSNATDNLTKEKIQQLIAAVGVESEEDTKHNIDAFDYNWKQSHFFSKDQLGKLGSFTGNVAQACDKKFTQLYQSDFEVTIISTTQHFASEFAADGSDQSDYYLSFGIKDQAFGLVGLPVKTATLWATQLLGDTKSTEESDRGLSQLEQSLLFDIASGIIGALSDSYDNYELQPDGDIVNGQMPVEFEDTEEVCKITFSVKKVDSEESSEAYFLILCDKLQTVVGEKVETGEELSAQDISKAMLNHVHITPVSVTAQLASTIFTFEEIVGLHVDDILLLDKNVNEPTELLLDGQTIFRGRPAKSKGNHAVVITELCNTK
jgi:flagellar motor switch protein FliM